MRRRDFMGLLAAAALPPVARAQPMTPVVGFLHLASPDALALSLVAEFVRGLGEAGYVENRNLAIEYRWAEGRADRIPALIEELVNRPVSVIVPMASANIVIAAKAATRTIPIVFMTGVDPVKAGLIDSVRTPGGNVTGISLLTSDLSVKRLELLLEMVTNARSVAYLRNPTTAIRQSEGELVQAAAQARGIQIRIADASDPSGIEEAFANVIRHQDALLVSADSFLNFQSEKLVELAALHKVPASYNVPYAVEIGGLMSYATDFPEAWRQTGVMTGLVLKGAKPAITPVQQVTKVNLHINLKTAKALNLELPMPLIGRAEKVYE